MKTYPSFKAIYTLKVTPGSELSRKNELEKLCNTGINGVSIPDDIKTVIESDKGKVTLISSDKDIDSYNNGFMSNVVNIFKLTLKQLYKAETKLRKLPINTEDQAEEKAALTNEINQLKTKIYNPNSLVNEINSYLSNFYAKGITLDIKDDIPLAKQIFVRSIDIPNSSQKDLQLDYISKN